MLFKVDNLLICIFICGVSVLSSGLDNTTSSDSPTTTTSDANATTDRVTTSEPSTTTTLAPELACQAYNNSCEECVKHTKCYYCYATNMCLFYPFSSGFPSSRDCDMGEVRWGVCWFNFKALVISLGVMGGVLFVSLCCCIYCCCRKKKNRAAGRTTQQDAKLEREKEARKIRADERKQERKLRNDEIRRKYGLIKDDHPYQRFEA